MLPQTVIGDLQVDYVRRSAHVRGIRVRLAQSEWEFLECLALCPRKLVTRRFLLSVLHRHDGKRPPIRSIDIIACRVRRKLRDACGENLIHHVWGDGYALYA